MRMNTFLIFSDLYDEKDQERILKDICKIDIDFACETLSRFGFYMKQIHRVHFNSWFVHNFYKKQNEKLLNNDLISRHGLFLAWKYILKHNKKGKVYNEKKDTENLLKLVLIIQEKYLDELNSEDIGTLAIANAFFNYYDCTNNLIARIYYIFIKNIKLNNDKYNMDEIKKTFYEKYKYTIEEFIYTVSLINGYIIKIVDSDKILLHNLTINPRKMPGFIDSEKIIKVRAILNDLSFDLKQGSKFSKEHSGKYDLLFFFNNPFYKINKNNFVPVERKCLESLLFESLFYKINECYNKDDSKFISAFGYMFEEYVAYITENTCKKINDKYHYIPEFEYHKNRIKGKSPDSMILYKNENDMDIILVIEVKSTRVKFEINKYEDIFNDDIEKMMDRIVKRPIKQAIRSINEIISNVKNESPITKDKKYYFIGVSMSNLPLKEEHKIIDKEFWEEYKNIMIQGCYSFNIEEFELFLQVIQCNYEMPFYWYLDEYDRIRNDGESFKNFIKEFPKNKDYFNFDDPNQDKVVIGTRNCDVISELQFECFENAVEFLKLENKC